MTSSGLYRAMAAGVLSLHAAYIAWVIFGAFITRRRAGTLPCGIIVEIFGFWCLLTALEQWLEVRGAVSAPIAALSFSTISTP